MSAKKPSDQLVESLNATLARFWLIDFKYRLKFYGYTYNVSEFSVDLTTRFEKLSFDDWWGCPITDYRIDRVIDEYSSLDTPVAHSSLF